MKTILFLTIVGLLSCGNEVVNGPSSNNTATTNNTAATNNTASNDWIWTPIENSKCGKGTEAGMGILDGTDDTRIVIYFEGGGACWDAASCHVLNAAVNIEKNYGESDFQNVIQTVKVHPLFDKNTGLFGDVPMVFVPYCTGDLHSGNSVGSYDAFNPNRKVHHNGGANVALFLNHLKARYPNVEEIFVVGVSAGGYGAMMNHHRFRAAFPGVPVHVLADGSPLIQPRDGRWTAWKNAWEFEIPPGCVDCVDTFNAFAKDAIAADAGRIALLTYLDDAVIGLYFAYPVGTMKAAVNGILTTYTGDWGQTASAFSKDGTEHVMLQLYDTLKDAEERSLKSFIAAWVEGQ